MNPDSRYRIGLAAILATAGLLFAPSLRFPFIWDDTAVVRDNPFIHTPGPAGIYFNPRYWKSLVPVSRSDYRPLQMLTLAAISRVGGRDPFPYRAVNLALHLLATIMVFILGDRLGAGRAAALLAAAFFAFHPVHVETVVGARNLAELMASVLLFSALFFFPRGDGRGRGIVSFLLFATALLYKENALILPPLLTILVMTGPGGFRKNKSDLIRTLPFWILAAAAGIGKLMISPGTALPGPHPAAHLIAGASRLLVTSVRLLILPVRLRVLYHFPRPESWAEPVWFCSLAGAVILAGILVAARKHRLLFSLLLCLGVSLLPSLYRLGSAGRVVAEQRLYLPSLFFCLAAAVLIGRSATIGTGRRSAVIVFLGWLICLPLFGLTGGYLRAWQGELPLWSRVTTLSPRAGIAFNNLAIALFRSGGGEAARREWERALELDPLLSEAHTNLGILEGRDGHWEGAAAHFRAALEAEPSHYPAAIYLAQVYRRLGRDEEAAGLLRGIRKENPFHAEAANELAILLEKMGRMEESAELYREAADLNPEYAVPLRNLAALYLRTGDFKRARSAARKAVGRDPDHPKGYSTLANIYIARGRLEEAHQVLRQGKKRHPNDWEITSRILALESAGLE